MTIVAAATFGVLLLSGGLLFLFPLLALIPAVSRWLEDAEVPIDDDED